MTIEELDRQSKPLRNAIDEWRNVRHLGGASGWYEDDKVWRFTIWHTHNGTIEIEVAEDGSRATVIANGEQRIAATPRALRALLTRMARTG